AARLRPTLSRARERLAVHPRDLLLQLQLRLPLAQDREDSGDVVPHLLDSHGVVELTGRELESEVEQLLLVRFEPLEQLGLPELAKLPHVARHHAPPPTREMNLVLMGSLCAARLMASRASASVTPESSNITRPGLTTATHPSGLPLPEPMRVSAGFLVTGLSGKTLIQTLPPRLMCRVIAIRAASICRLVIQHGSIACKPKSPKVKALPRSAAPPMRPRCTLRHFTRLGVSILLGD